MTPLLSFLLKANITLVLLYAVYFLCFRRDTFYGHIRWYLLAIIACAGVFPLIDASGWLPAYPATTEMAHNVPRVEMVYHYVFHTQAMPSESVAEPVVNKAIPMGVVLWWGWLSAVVFLLGKRLFQLVCIGRLWHRCSCQYFGSQAVMVVNERVQPFSFWGRIFLNPALYSAEELDGIVMHERIHCRQGHTIDILLAEVLVCLCWFNPVAWLLRHDIKQNLEYHTDSKVLLSGHDRKHYQYSLLRTCLHQTRKPAAGAAFQIVNHFHFNHLKKRIMMMNKTKSPRIMAAKYVLIAPALAAALLTLQMPGLQALELANANVRSEHSATTESGIGAELAAGARTGAPACAPPVPSAPPTPSASLAPPDSSKPKPIRITTKNQPRPLFILDGNIITEEESQSLDPNSIASVEVFKDLKNPDLYVRLYGEEAENGIVAITSKGKKMAVPRIPKEISSILELRNGPALSDKVIVVTVKTGDEPGLGKIEMVFNLSQLTPLYLIDGEEVESIVGFPENVYTVTAITNQTATEQYGEKAKYGAIQVITQKEYEKNPDKYKFCDGE